MRSFTISLTSVVLLLLSSPCSSSAVTELDADSFYSVLGKDAERDVLVAFHYGSSENSVKEKLKVIDELAARLPDVEAPISVTTYDVAVHSAPREVHIHPGDFLVVLFPARGTGREPVVFESKGGEQGHGHGHHHDHHGDHHHSHGEEHQGAHLQGEAEGKQDGEHSTKSGSCSAAGQAEADSGRSSCGCSTCKGSKKKSASTDTAHSPSCSAGHHHHHDHPHRHHSQEEAEAEAELSVPALLQWLKRSSTFPSEIPEVTVAEKWRGKSLFKAVQSGLEAIEMQMQELKRENSALKREVQQLQEKLQARDRKWKQKQ